MIRFGSVTEIRFGSVRFGSVETFLKFGSVRFGGKIPDSVVSWNRDRQREGRKRESQAEKELESSGI